MAQQFLQLNILREFSSDHMCYILKSSISNRIYVGYTINFSRRLRQHNGEIVGGAKKTRNGRPWYPICIIRGFYEASSALRFEYKLQHSGRLTSMHKMLQILLTVINGSDGLLNWPLLNIKWYDRQYAIPHPHVINNY